SPADPTVNGATGPSPSPQPGPAKPKHEEHRDAYREAVETVIFVVVLVLLLKTFVAEAFVIPTGSMAETLYGIQREVECPKCGYKFPANFHRQVSPQEGQEKSFVIGCTCPNCLLHLSWNDVKTDWNNGDRVLVAKYPFDQGYLGRPRRFGTTVFKYPEKPQIRQEPMNYIKRIVGLPGETIAIYDGDLYVLTGLDYPGRDRPDRPEDLWKKPFMYEDDPEALDAFRAGRFQIVRRRADEMLAMRRIVYDNNHQPSDLTGPAYQRWYAAGGWKPDNPDQARSFQTDAGGGDWQWLRYRHLLPDENRTGVKKEYIHNFLGYNSCDLRSATNPNQFELGSTRGMNQWVGDLMLEASVRVQGQQGEL